MSRHDGAGGVTVLTLHSRHQTSVTLGAGAGASPPMAQTLSAKTGTKAVFVLHIATLSQ